MCEEMRAMRTGEWNNIQNLFLHFRYYNAHLFDLRAHTNSSLLLLRFALARNYWINIEWSSLAEVRLR